MIRVLLIGCGDVALRTADLLRSRARLYGLTRRPDDVPRLRAHGIVPIVGDLDELATLSALARGAVRGTAFRAAAVRGPRRPAHAEARSQRWRGREAYHSASSTFRRRACTAIAPARGSSEMRPRRAQTPRARRRVAAEDRLRDWAKRYGVSAVDPARAGHLRGDAAAARAAEAGHAGARAATTTSSPITSTPTTSRARRSPRCSAPSPTAPTTSPTTREMKMGGWFDAVADAFHLPRPPRVSWEEAEQRIAPMLLSFMSESRRLSNARMKRELRVRLKYPTPQRAARRSRAARPQEAAGAAAVTDADADGAIARARDPLAGCRRAARRLRAADPARQADRHAAAAVADARRRCGSRPAAGRTGRCCWSSSSARC